MPENDRVLVDMVVGAPVDAVWRALREPAEVRRWFGWDYDDLDREIEQIFVEQAQPDELTGTLSWPDGDRFVIEPIDERRTSLRVLRPGHLGAPDFDGAYDPIDEGWITFTQQLRFSLERHPGQDRRTASGHGIDLGPDDDPLLARLGLRPLGEDPVGSQYAVDDAAGPDGVGFAGEIFFQTDLQVGLTVAEENDALLVIARTPPSAAPPNGEAMFVLSTYGLDPAARDAVEQRWRRWWGAFEEGGSEPSSAQVDETGGASGHGATA